MRIAYGVMGYGRGHAMRSLSVLPALMQEHEVTVFTANDAYEVLAPKFPTVRIPMIGYRYNERGGHSAYKTVMENLSPMADLENAAATKLHLANVIGRRALAALAAQGK